MTLLTGAVSYPDQIDKPIPRFECTSLGAGLVGAASAIDLTSSNAGKADARPFRTPDRAITVPDARRRTLESLARRNDGDGREEEKAHCLAYSL